MKCPECGLETDVRTENGVGWRCGNPFCDIIFFTVDGRVLRRQYDVLKVYREKQGVV